MFKRTQYLRSFLGLILCGILAFGASGCVYLVVGAVGVVGGYVVSPDTVEGTTARAIEEVWDSTKEICGIMGKIVEELPSGNQLVATINGSQVTVSLIAVNASTTKLTVKARKAFMPKIDVAQDVYSKIVNKMEK
ncbi:MAG: hypothetical protein HQL19_05135 [Candidatus Omnitrophica bacterium]|nr:hypothetical protein [Candidatus Omnitrophota bacterium]